MLKIEIRESGGISGGRRRLTVENGEISFVLIDRDNKEHIKCDFALTDEEMNSLTDLAEKLFADSIRNSYGGGMPVCDAVTTSVHLELNGKSKNISTISDSSDPEPKELQDLVSEYWRIIRKHQSTNPASP